MKNERKQKFIYLGPEMLAAALLNLAVHSDEADDLIEQLIATPKENIQRFKKKISDLKHSRRFIDWRGAAGLARKLEMLLQDLKAGMMIRSQESNSLRRFTRPTIPFLRCVMTLAYSGVNIGDVLIWSMK